MRLSTKQILKRMTVTMMACSSIFIIAACDYQELAVAPSTVMPDTTRTTANVKPASSQALQLVWLKIYPAEVDQGDEITISAKAVNNGSTGRTYTAELLIDGTIRAIKNVVIQAGETQVLDFQLPVYTPGTYQVTLCGLAGRFKVNPETTTYSNNSQNTVNRPDNSSTVSGCCGTQAPAVTNQPASSPVTSSGCCATPVKESTSSASQGNPPATLPKRSKGGCCP